MGGSGQELGWRCCLGMGMGRGKDRDERNLDAHRVVGRLFGYTVAEIVLC